MTTLDLDAIKARIDKAHEHIGALCTGDARWTMHIPVDPTRDSDLILTEALCDAERLLDEFKRLTDQRDRLYIALSDLMGASGDVADARAKAGHAMAIINGVLEPDGGR